MGYYYYHNNYEIVDMKNTLKDRDVWKIIVTNALAIRSTQ